MIRISDQEPFGILMFTQNPEYMVDPISNSVDLQVSPSHKVVLNQIEKSLDGTLALIYDAIEHSIEQCLEYPENSQL